MYSQRMLTSCYSTRANVADHGSPMVKLVEGSGLFAGLLFHPLVPKLFDAPYLVRDFTEGMDHLPKLEDTGYVHDVGRYNERRRAMYETALFGSDDPWAEKGEPRDIHIAIDIGGPAGTPIHSVADCTIHSVGYNAADGDYGHVIVTEQVLNGHRVFALCGHLDAASTAGKAKGDKIARGDVLGWFGDRHENGGWHPHVHFQLSLVEPATHDMPGVVSSSQHAQALRDYPDPRMVLGALYEGDAFL